MASPAMHAEVNWAEANQALLVAEFARLKHQLSPGDRTNAFPASRAAMTHAGASVLLLSISSLRSSI